MSEVILDLPEFLERVQDDKELLLELFDIYIEDYNQKKNQIKDAVEKQDSEQLRSLAHSLKGASGNISAKAMWKIFMQLEENGKNEDLTGCEELLSSMDEHFEQLIARIGEVKEEFKG